MNSNMHARGHCGVCTCQMCELGPQAVTLMSDTVIAKQESLVGALFLGSPRPLGRAKTTRSDGTHYNDAKWALTYVPGTRNEHPECTMRNVVSKALW